MRLHERTMPVQRAEVELRSKFWDIVEELDLGYAEMTAVVAAVQSDVARRIDEQLPQSGPDGYPQVASAVVVAQHQFGLTDVEILSVLADFQGRLAKYMLRAERHPDEPDRKADEA